MNPEANSAYWVELTSSDSVVKFWPNPKVRRATRHVLNIDNNVIDGESNDLRHMTLFENETKTSV